MSTGRPTFWNLIALVALCLGYIVLRGGASPDSLAHRSAPLCTAPVETEIQNPAIGNDAQWSANFSGPAMKYGASPRNDAEAEFLAFTMRHTLLASDADYERIRRDLANIRQQFPDVEEISYFGDYADGQLIVMLITPLNPLISTEEYDELNRFMGLCKEERFASFNGYDVATLWFPARMNMVVLAERYHPWFMPNLKDLSSPNVTGGVEDFIRATSASQTRGSMPVDSTISYEFEDGWLDCYDGCECKDVHTFETDASGDVVFIGREFLFMPGWEQVCMDTWNQPT